jgi:tetrapyrrole methylase family protein/MazG family protein
VSTVRIVGLGPAGLDRLSPAVLDLLLDPAVPLVLRTIEHPAAADLAAQRDAITCDDLYESVEDFEGVYRAIADRVLAAAARGPVTYAVPGSALVGERAVAILRAEVPSLALHPGESFLDLTFARVGLDPLARGVQVLDAHDLPAPLLLHLPTVFGQIDGRGAIDAVRDSLLALLPHDTAITRLADLGAPEEAVTVVTIEELREEHAGLRVSLFLDVAPPGWPGLVQTNARLRAECPWDREQTHHSLAKHLLEEAYETLEAIEALPVDAPKGEVDVPGYVDLEEELGDLLLQVVFHATLASEAGVFGVEEVAESIRRKLVARHPHVFGDVDATTAEHVMANWQRLKQDEKARESLLDGVPLSLPALARAHEFQSRAAGVGFDWPDLDGVLAKVHEEIAEVVEAAGEDDADTVGSEVGDLLFSVVNLSRRLGVDPEQALRAATTRFDRRFRTIEADLAGKTLEEMDVLWEEAKKSERRKAKGETA